MFKLPEQTLFHGLPNNLPIPKATPAPPTSQNISKPRNTSTLTIRAGAALLCAEASLFIVSGLSVIFDLSMTLKNTKLNKGLGRVI